METIELRLFIKQALLEIIGGVKDAQGEAPPGSVAPSDINTALETVGHKVSHLQPVEFELQVTAEKKKSSGARISVLAGFVGGGAEGSSARASQVHSVLKFVVPIHLPDGGPSWPMQRATQQKAGP